MEYHPTFERFRDRVEIISKHYRSNPMAEELLEDTRFDACRSNQYPDDVVVMFLKDGVNLVQTYLCQRGSVRQSDE